jgi:hypothetical protein
MRPAEVLAIELRQYQGEGLRTLAPIVMGQTQEATDQKAGVAGSKPRRQWDEAQFLEAPSERRDPAIVDTAKALIAWAKTNADRVLFNDAPNVGAIAPEFKTTSGPCAPMRLWSDCFFAFGFDRLKRTGAFSSLPAREELREKLDALPGVWICTEVVPPSRRQHGSDGKGKFALHPGVPHDANPIAYNSNIATLKQLLRRSCGWGSASVKNHSPGYNLVHCRLLLDLREPNSSRPFSPCALAEVDPKPPFTRCCLVLTWPPLWESR